MNSEDREDPLFELLVCVRLSQYGFQLVHTDKTVFQIPVTYFGCVGDVVVDDEKVVIRESCYCRQL